jgi:hypothetical protein
LLPATAARLRFRAAVYDDGFLVVTGGSAKASAAYNLGSVILSSTASFMHSHKMRNSQFGLPVKIKLVVFLN